MHVPKKGLRALGIAESYSGREQSTLAGVVMRKDLRIDGFAFCHITVGGMDGTDAILGMVRDLNRADINVILLSGCVIAWFNILDPAYISGQTGIPVIGISYEESPGLEEEIRHHFPGDRLRLSAYEKLGVRIPADMGTGYTGFIRSWGISHDDAVRLCRDFTLDGKVPEPLRVARLCARSLPSWGRNRNFYPP